MLELPTGLSLRQKIDVVTLADHVTGKKLLPDYLTVVNKISNKEYHFDFGVTALNIQCVKPDGEIVLVEVKPNGSNKIIWVFKKT